MGVAHGSLGGAGMHGRRLVFVSLARPSQVLAVAFQNASRCIDDVRPFVESLQDGALWPVSCPNGMEGGRAPLVVRGLHMS